MTTPLSAAGDAPDRAHHPRRRARLWAEFLILFAGVPLLLAFGLEARMMWPLLGACFAVGLGLLAVTPGFRWGELLHGPLIPRPVHFLGFLLVTLALCFGLVLWLIPGALFWLPQRRPELWLTIVLLYPVLSALPQEIIFRVLFFRRYGLLFPSRAVGVAVNAALFGLAHLFLSNWVSLAMTVAGGAIFAWAHLSGPRPNLLFPLLMHAIAGVIIFTCGLGRFFFHGALQ